MTDNGVAKASSSIPSEQEKPVQEAADGCPSAAIEVN